MSDVSSYIAAGYDVKLPVQLYTVDSAGARQMFTIDPGATVKTALVTMERDKILLRPTTSDNAAAGADWANSLIVAEFAAVDTSSIDLFGDAILEVSVDDGARLPWFVVIPVVKGMIES